MNPDPDAEAEAPEPDPDPTDPFYLALLRATDPDAPKDDPADA